ncbi:MAG: PEGA domain-containing protein [Phycisphaerales bacterium]|nr:MAG: PEGA domain-containing protein [Phycisphaerales bacterium]
MNRRTVGLVLALGTASLLWSGCVERELTINTEPQDALVTLNDEQIGQSPVTVAFNWYGDYRVRASKEGYQTLETNRELKAPWYDWFPLDFFAQVLYPGRIVDSTEWTFELAPRQAPTREELIDQAETARSQLD